MVDGQLYGVKMLTLPILNNARFQGNSWKQMLQNEEVFIHKLRLPNVKVVPFPVIKSPQYTVGDFMFLYRFVRRRRRRRRRRPQILVHAITFEQLFGFLSFLAQLLALTCRLPD